MCNKRERKIHRVRLRALCGDVTNVRTLFADDNYNHRLSFLCSRHYRSPLPNESKNCRYLLSRLAIACSIYKMQCKEFLSKKSGNKYAKVNRFQACRLMRIQKSWTAEHVASPRFMKQVEQGELLLVEMEEDGLDNDRFFSYHEGRIYVYGFKLRTCTHGWFPYDHATGRLLFV